MERMNLGQPNVIRNQESDDEEEKVAGSHMRTRGFYKPAKNATNDKFVKAGVQKTRQMGSMGNDVMDGQ